MVMLIMEIKTMPLQCCLPQLVETMVLNIIRKILSGHDYIKGFIEIIKIILVLTNNLMEINKVSLLNNNSINFDN